MRGSDEIADPAVRQSGITSHAIGVGELETLLRAVPADGHLQDYEAAAVNDNILALATQTGREWRFATLRRLYLLRPDAILFRALRDLWPGDSEAHPLLACVCALATDTVFRASASAILDSTAGDDITAADFAGAIEATYPDAYAASTLKKTAANAYASWEQSGHLGKAKAGSKPRRRAVCRPENVAYALLIGHLDGHRGEALFDTVWARVLDHPRSHLYDLAFAASQRGMLEFRNAGGVVEVGFRELLRPVEGELL